MKTNSLLKNLNYIVANLEPIFENKWVAVKTEIDIKNAVHLSKDTIVGLECFQLKFAKLLGNMLTGNSEI